MTRGTGVHVLVTLALLLVAGCGGNSDSGEASCPPPGFASERRELSANGAEITYLTDVAVAETNCGDRVVFEFRDDASGARVEYLPREQALVEDGSGNRVEAEGEAFLVVRLDSAATAESDGDELEFTYMGPRRLRPDDARYVREIVKTGDFEAVVTWVVGLDEERPFRVATSGRRLTVELA